MAEQDTVISLPAEARIRQRPEVDPAEPAPLRKTGRRSRRRAWQRRNWREQHVTGAGCSWCFRPSFSLSCCTGPRVTSFAYTDDAYVTSDFVNVAPYISGRIASVNVVDNQTVKKGELLATIDPTPFQLALNEKQAKKTEAEAQLAVDRDVIAAAQAQRDDAAAKLRLASDNVHRATPITAAGFYSRQGLDTLTAKEQEAKAALADTEAAIAKAHQTLALHQANVAAISAEIAYLQWQLEQTKLLAPTDGTITQLTLRTGDQAVENKPLIGLVDAHAWRIYANYKESVIRHMKVGHTAWVWLDAHPWRFHRATIQGIARGISREQTDRKLLPYVAPTTDWIRLERRFPVTLVLQDLSPDITLRMGADARTIIFY